MNVLDPSIVPPEIYQIGPKLAGYLAVWMVGLWSLTARRAN